MRGTLPIVKDSAPRCLDGHCVTCSDEGVPMRVVTNCGDGLVLCVADDGAEMEVMTALVEPTAPGDMLLVHAGTALLRLAPLEPT